MEEFKKAIKSYLDQRAKEDELFAKAYQKKNKHISGCCNYILCEVQKKAKNGMAAMTDDEVFSLAVHYYDDDEAQADKEIKANVVISGQYAPKEKVVHTAEEKPKKVSKKKEKDPYENRQLSLFEF